MDAIILAGGKGNRMEDVLPKPLVKVKDKAILGYQLDYLLGNEFIGKIILSLGYRPDEIIEYVKANYPGNNKIIFSVENEPLGTAGALKLAVAKATGENVLVLNCDDLTDIDIAELAKINEDAICVAHPQLPFGLVKEENGFAVFQEKPVLQEWVSCGWYFFRREKLFKILPDNGSLEYDVFPRLKMRLFYHQGFWQPLNSKKDILEFEQRNLPQAF